MVVSPTPQSLPGVIPEHRVINKPLIQLDVVSKQNKINNRLCWVLPVLPCPTLSYGVHLDFTPSIWWHILTLHWQTSQRIFARMVESGEDAKIVLTRCLHPCAPQCLYLRRLRFFRTILQIPSVIIFHSDQEWFISPPSFSTLIFCARDQMHTRHILYTKLYPNSLFYCIWVLCHTWCAQGLHSWFCVRDNMCSCSGDHIQCWASNLDWLHAWQVL